VMEEPRRPTRSLAGPLVVLAIFVLLLAFVAWGALLTAAGG
jgi:hypothetical protein